MLLIKRISQTMNKPVFEIMEWDASELEYQACFFSIDDNSDKPMLPEYDPYKTDEEYDDALHSIF